MKRICILLFVLITLASYSQITITSNNIGSVGDEYVMAYVEDIPDHIEPGPPGPGQLWDYSSLVHDYLDTVRFLNPDSTPYAGIFPASNLAISQDDETLWGFMIKNSFELSIKGAVLPVPELGIIPAELIPKDVLANFPLNYLDSADRTFYADIRMESPEPAVDSIRYKSTTYKTSKVDAWGDMKLPAGTLETLRLKEERVMVDSVWTKFIGFWVFVSRTVDSSHVYYWLTDVPGNGYFLVNMEVDPSSQQISTLGYMYDPVVGMAEPGEPLASVYPNPATDRITFRTRNDFTGTVSIIDAQGRLLCSRRIPGRNHWNMDISGLDPGMYLFRVVSDDKRRVSVGKVLKIR
ncbi:MAG: T9SS type A sorting domain-containing protein [Bacteroidales bacterium]